MIFIIYWNRFVSKWIMTDTDGHFVERFEDCPVFNKKYPGLDKSKRTMYYDEAAKKLRDHPLKEEDDGREIKPDNHDGSNRERESDSDARVQGNE